MRSISWLSAAMFLLLLCSKPAEAVTYFYDGNVYSTNPNPASFGTHMTGSVIFSCNPCADGSYDLSGGQITNFQLTSGMFTDTIAQFGLVQFLLSSNTIVEWQAFGSLNPTFELGSVGSTDPAILAAFQSHGSHRVLV
jgi:hypothetical protein